MYAITSLHQNLLSDLEIESMPLTSDMDVETARKVSLIDSFFKKFVDGKSSELADAACLDKFLVSNDSCRTYCYSPSHIFHDTVIGEIKRTFDDIAFRGPDLVFDLASISAGFGVGPGANIACDSYDFYTKLYNSSLSRTNDQLYREYRCAILSNPLVSQAELLRSAHKGDRIVAGSLLSFVPKTREISRSICTEPTLNMLFQKGIGACLERALKRVFSIDLSKQPLLNRKMAQLGSIDGSFGTIDLSSASDSISIELCRLLLPPYLVRWLELARSPVTTLPSGQVVKLEMISSMGNAFTFPLMTLIFASLVTACYRVMGLKPEYGTKQNGPQNFAVFGDDIIVLSQAYEFVVSTLKVLGFSVNESKSFNAGCFRESCGGDFFRGHNIRGVYLRSLSQESHVYSAFNRIVRWSSACGIFLPRTVACLLDMIPPNRRFLIPQTDGDSEGLKVPLELFDASPKTFDFGCRRCLKLRSRGRTGEYRLCPSCLKAEESNTRAYSALVNVPRSFAIPDDKVDGERVPRGTLPGFIYNGPGLLSAFLGGFIRNGRISLRSEDTGRAKVRRRFNSSWNWATAPGCNGRDLFWEFTSEQYLRAPCMTLTSQREPTL